MLSEEEKEAIIEEIQKCKTAGGTVPKSTASLEALRVIQNKRGWISEEIEEIAGALGMTPAELDSVATFYSLIYRKPVGKHVILICDSVCCWIRGYEEAYKHLSKKIGIGFNETTEDGLFTLLPVACLGACDHAPAMMVDEELYGDLTTEKIDEIIGKYK